MLHISTMFYARRVGIGCKRRYKPRGMGLADGEPRGAVGNHAAASSCLQGSRGGDQGARGGEGGRFRQEQGKRRGAARARRGVASGLDFTFVVGVLNQRFCKDPLREPETQPLTPDPGPQTLTPAETLTHPGSKILNLTFSLQNPVAQIQNPDPDPLNHCLRK